MQFVLLSKPIEYTDFRHRIKGLLFKRVQCHLRDRAVLIERVGRTGVTSLDNDSVLRKNVNSLRCL